MNCASPALVNPSPETASLTKSSATRRSSPVRSWRVYAYSALVSRRIATGPGSPWCSSMNRRSPASTSRTASSRCGPLGCGSPSGGIFRSRSTRTTFSQSLKRRPNSGASAIALRSTPASGSSPPWHSRQYSRTTGRSPAPASSAPARKGNATATSPKTRPTLQPSLRLEMILTRQPPRVAEIPASARRETAEESRISLQYLTPQGVPRRNEQRRPAASGQRSSAGRASGYATIRRPRR